MTNLSSVILVLQFSRFLLCRAGLPKFVASYPLINYPVKVAENWAFLRDLHESDNWNGAIKEGLGAIQRGPAPVTGPQFSLRGHWSLTGPPFPSQALFNCLFVSPSPPFWLHRFRWAPPRIWVLAGPNVYAWNRCHLGNCRFCLEAMHLFGQNGSFSAFWRYEHKERLSGRGSDVKWHMHSACLDASTACG